MATAHPIVLDYDDYCAIPNDGKRYEILAGKLYVNPAPNPRHQLVGKRLQRFLERYFEIPGEREVFNSPIDLILSLNDVAQPDIVVVLDRTQISARGIEGAPALVVEVLSPSSIRYDRQTKAARYAQLGIDHYWIADPVANTLDCFCRSGDGYETRASFAGAEPFAHPDFPGLEVDLAAVWL